MNRGSDDVVTNKATAELTAEAKPVGTTSPDQVSDMTAREARRQDDAELLERILFEHERSGYLRQKPITEGESPDQVDNSATLTPGLRPKTLRAPCSEYQVLASRLVAYAMPVFKDWLRSGNIKKELLDRHLANPLSGDDYLRMHSSLAARDALAVAIVIAGEEFFRSNVIPNHKWRSDGRASLETYFVVGCLYTFAKAVREWRREHPEWSDTLVPFNGDELLSIPAASNSMELTNERDLVLNLIKIAPPLVAQIISGMLAGYTYAEIGEQVGLSERAIEGRMYRFRTNILKDANRGRIEIPADIMARGEAA